MTDRISLEYREGSSDISAVRHRGRGWGRGEVHSYVVGAEREIPPLWELLLRGTVRCESTPVKESGTGNEGDCPTSVFEV